MDFFELHRNLPREGPGDDASTLRALRLVPDLPERPDVLDIGCGPGAQTLVLAHATDGTITAVDLHQPFLMEVQRRAQLAGVGARVRTIQAPMGALPFEPGSFDLVWAEGSIFIMGFERGLRAWLPLVRPGGSVVASELTWLTGEVPEPARRFWSDAYPAMTTVEENRAAVARSGYRHVADFVLPRSAWFRDYLDPLEARITALTQERAGDPDALAFLAAERREIEIVRRYGEGFGYVFYVAQRP